MAYRSKNLGSSRRAATTAKVNTQDKLFAARNSLRTFKEEDKELTKLTKKLDENTEGSMFLTRYLKSSKENKKIGKTQYDEWKNKFDSTVKRNKYENVFFPEFDDWWKNNTKAEIDGKKFSRSDSSLTDHDPERLNIWLDMMMGGADGK